MNDSIDPFHKNFYQNRIAQLELDRRENFLCIFKQEKQIKELEKEIHELRLSRCHYTNDFSYPERVDDV